MRSPRTTLLAATLLCVVSPARADDEALQERVQRLEERVVELEQEQQAQESQTEAREAGMFESVQALLPAWVRSLRISGNADASYIHGQKNSIGNDGQFSIDNTRLFLDADLMGETSIGDRTALEAASFHFEWDFIRQNDIKNDVGELYVRTDGILGSRFVNMKLGRVSIPFGEEYERFSKKRPENPLISFSAPAPYGWDEGVMLFGSANEGMLQYRFAVMEGDYGFAENSTSDPTLVSKLILRPTSWLHLSASAMHTGKLGKDDPSDFGETALKWGGTHGFPVGFYTGVPTYQGGVEVPRDPSPRLDSVDAYEVDAILSREEWGRLWLAFGQTWVDSRTSSAYDRSFAYWIAEGIFELRVLSELLDGFYTAVRYSGMDTLDSDKGYYFAAMNRGGSLGFNSRRVNTVSTGLGLRLGRNFVVKTEYSWFDFDVIAGVPDSIRSQAGSKNYFGVGLSVAY